ncbi:endo-1,4-beta-xylanase [Microbacterium sp. EYE_5]|uniref:endo-1,4-beta-xylanase n=1 Tax=unclassified Microbacterium TaxID=2609290 RepID=UPI0020042A66|nr:MULTISPECIES: endo-1,4-beta-xylanase [unclassified Microbacterium]MCK6079403.1 endo-1,4-beta-xylanase [Microbacterium sp. EYE_382]MCK6084673.1 endo-1,4-beta-xylanase [Microbacterium sp. EYE_384]MCK6123098.1 endo-1,4-beta-xylanase [Microbacterium sp. EYE_80]MCK6125437.1 endo-1,4-beta-xylanase [Microbacterium sp. EYE_79]MCK6140357.1 endo-1,4-beta-xylanase [Microbacterium sp. EYE_39]
MTDRNSMSASSRSTSHATDAGVAPRIDSLRTLADRGGLVWGSGSVKASLSTADERPANYFTDPRYGRTLAHQFNSLSPENEFKFDMVQPEEGVFDFDGLDRLLQFAEAHQMQFKAHSGISRAFNPPWLAAKENAASFRAALVTHFETIMQRYTGRMDRWDIVTEPFAPLGGEGLERNLFYERLGSGYIAEAFRIAHDADPTARLFFNENLTEYYPAKRREMYELVSSMVADGVPVHGIALQMHETIHAPAAGELTAIVREYRELGLEVTIAELDVHTLDDHSQAQIYRDVLQEALDAGIRDISVWGFTDRHLYTWLPGAKPTLFDEQFEPKPAYFAVHDVLQAFANRLGMPTERRNGEIDSLG